MQPRCVALQAFQGSPRQLRVMCHDSCHDTVPFAQPGRKPSEASSSHGWEHIPAGFCGGAKAAEVTSTLRMLRESFIKPADSSFESAHSDASTKSVDSALHCHGGPGHFIISHRGSTHRHSLEELIGPCLPRGPPRTPRDPNHPNAPQRPKAPPSAPHKAGGTLTCMASVSAKAASARSEAAQVSPTSSPRSSNCCTASGA